MGGKKQYGKGECSPRRHVLFLLQLKQGSVSSLGLLVKYNIPFLGCPKHVIKSRIWDSFLTIVRNMDMSIIWPRGDSLSDILCRLFY